MALPHSAPLAVSVRAGEHACCRFADCDDRDRLAVAFARDGLRRADKVVHLVDSDDPAPLVSRLGQLDPIFQSAMTSGQFELFRACDAYVPDGRFEVERMLAMLRQTHDRALAEGYRGLSLIGEIPVALCERPSVEKLAECEARIESVMDAPSYSILCQYDHGRFAAGILSDVVEAHQVDASPELAAIGRDGELAAARDRRCDALRLAGELDFGCAQAVTEVLDAHFHGPLRLDLADLSYVDVAGMRALRGRKGQRLVISPASGAVQRLLELLGWDTDPAIELAEGG